MEETETQKKMEGQIQLWKHIKGFIDSAALRCAVQLGLADIIQKHGEPVTVDQIAAALSIPSLNEDSLYRILRYLVHLNLFYCIDDGGEKKYALTPASELLVRGQDTSLAPFVSFILRPDSVQMMQYMKVSLEGSDTPLQRFLGMEHEKEKFKWAEESPESNEEYMEVMRGNTSIVIGEIVSGLRESGVFDEAGTLVDVGGNTGQVAEAISTAFPHLKCSVLELPHVVEAVAVPLAVISFVKGDMFESVPKADVVFMKGSHIMVMNSFGLPSGYLIRHGHNMEMSYTPGPSGFINAPLPQSGYQLPNVRMFQQNPINIGCQNSNVSGGNHFEILGNGPSGSMSRPLAPYRHQPTINLYQQLHSSNPQVSHLHKDSAVPDYNQPMECEDSAVPENNQPVGCEDHHLHLSN